MISTKTLSALLLATAAVWVSAACWADDTARDAKQAELDQACEAAREQKLEPIRQGHIEKCVNEAEFDTREECETFYADYGAATGGGRAPLFYDLPPCVEAFNYQKSERSGA